MTILVAYVPRPEGQAALDKGVEIAKRRKERLVVVNASPGGRKEDVAMADAQDIERVVFEEPERVPGLRRDVHAHHVKPGPVVSLRRATLAAKEIKKTRPSHHCLFSPRAHQQRRR